MVDETSPRLPRAASGAHRRLFRASYSDQLVDARAALAWVHDDAVAYGGDPDAPPFLIVHGTLDALVLHREARPTEPDPRRVTVAPRV